MSRFISNISWPTTRTVFVAAALAASAASMANTVTVPRAGTIRTARPTIMDTRSFFPQVNVTVSQKRITPKNPSLNRLWTDKTPNGKVGGGVGGDTTVGRNSMFPGIGFTGWIPADPQIAVSKTHVVQVTNSDIAFFSKTGTKQFQQGMGPNSFFSGVGAGNFTFDPKVFFDTTSGRFFVVILDEDDNTKSSAFLIAISDDGDPNGKWTKYKVDNKFTKDQVDAWLDYEGWGFNKDAVVATGNMFTFAGGYAGYVQAFVFKKSEMLAAQPLTVTKFIDEGTFTIQVAKMDDKTSPYVFGCSLDGSAGSSAIRVYAWRNFNTTPEMVYTSVSVPDFNFIGTPPSAGGAFLASLSGRLVDATYRTGSLLTCHTTRAATGNTRSQVSWYDFKPGSWPASGSPTLFQSGDVALPGDNWAFIPGIHKNSLGDISMIFSRSSNSIIADVMGVARKSTDPKGQMGIPFQLASSDAAYRLSGRWGDYVSTCVDPSDDATFWGNTMKSNSNGTWATAIVSWKVSTGGGGGGGNNGIKPNGVSTLEGAYASGNLGSIQNYDAASYDANAKKRADGSYAAAIQATYVIANQKNSVAGVEIFCKSFVTPSRSPVGYLFLWNYNTSRWDYIKSFNLSGNPTSYSAQVTSNGSAYVSTAKQMRVLFRGLDPVRRNGYSPAPFRLKADSIQLVIATK